MASASQQREISETQLGYIEHEAKKLEKRSTGPQQIYALQLLLTNAGFPDAPDRAVLGHSHWVKRLNFFRYNMEKYEQNRYCHYFLEYYNVPVDDAPQRLHQFPLLYEYTSTIRDRINVINVSNWFQWYFIEPEGRHFKLEDDMADTNALQNEDRIRDRLIADPRSHTANAGTPRRIPFNDYLDKQEMRKNYKDQFQH